MSHRLETTRRFEKDFRKLASDLKHWIIDTVVAHSQESWATMNELDQRKQFRSRV